MIKNPRLGQRCYILVDIWESLCAVPAKIVSINPKTGNVTARWKVTEDHAEDYNNLQVENLYSSHDEAVEELISMLRPIGTDENMEDIIDEYV